MLKQLLAQTLDDRYSKDNFNSSESELFTNILNDDDSFSRNFKFLEYLHKKKPFFDEPNLPQMQQPTSGLKPTSGGTEESDLDSSREPKESTPLSEEFSNFRQSSRGLLTNNIFEDLNSAIHHTVSPKLLSLYHKLVGNFTDSWTHYLRRDDGRFTGLKNGKFDHRSAYKSELSPNIFFKDVNTIRESDLIVYMFADISGSMFHDMGKTKGDLSYYSPLELSNLHNGKENLINVHEDQNMSSSYNVTTLAIAIGNVLKSGGCDLNFNFFNDSNINIANNVYDHKYLSKYFDLLNRYGGHGTELSQSSDFLTRELPLSKNKDKLIFVLTDGGIQNTELIIKTFTNFNRDYNCKFLFVGIGARFGKEFYQIPCVDIFNYSSGKDLVSRFPGDFSNFLLNKYFLEE